MNPLDLLHLAVAAAGKADVGQTLRDALLLYGVAQKIKAAGKLDVGVMVKDGSLPAVVAALGRTVALVDALLKDKDAAPRVTAVLAGLVA